MNHYSFGMLMPGRTYTSVGYRAGFNGKESDNEVSGSGNQYDYGFRIYNPRLGRFLSVDPLSKSFPWWTPYQFAGNMPIAAIDLDGMEIKTMAGDGTIIISIAYGVITKGPGEVMLTEEEIKLLQAQLTAILNNNPGTTIKIKDIPDPIYRERAINQAKMENPDASYDELLEMDYCVKVQFNLILFDAGTSNSKISSHIKNISLAYNVWLL